VCSSACAKAARFKLRHKIGETLVGCSRREEFLDGRLEHLGEEHDGFVVHVAQTCFDLRDATAADVEAGDLELRGGIRFEIPSRYNHFQRLNVRAASWDLSHVHLADPKTGAILCRLFPLDKHKNAQGKRAAKGSPMDKPAATVSPAPSGMAPLSTQPSTVEPNARQKYVADVVIETRLAQLG